MVTHLPLRWACFYLAMRRDPKYSGAAIWRCEPPFSSKGDPHGDGEETVQTEKKDIPHGQKGQVARPQDREGGQTSGPEDTDRGQKSSSDRQGPEAAHGQTQEKCAGSGGQDERNRGCNARQSGWHRRTSSEPGPSRDEIDFRVTPSRSRRRLARHSCAKAKTASRAMSFSTRKFKVCGGGARD